MTRLVTEFKIHHIYTDRNRSPVDGQTHEDSSDATSPGSCEAGARQKQAASLGRRSLAHCLRWKTREICVYIPGDVR